MQKPTIGYISLGMMGGNMTECLLNIGFKLNVMGRIKDTVATARGAVK